MQNHPLKFILLPINVLNNKHNFAEFFLPKRTKALLLKYNLKKS